MTKQINLLRRRVLFVLATLIAPVAHGQPDSISFQISGQPPGAVDAIARVLEKRFDSLSPGMFDTVRTQVQGDRISIRFGGWSPSPSTPCLWSACAGYRAQREDT